MSRTRALLFSFTLLAAPAANECSPADKLPCDVEDVLVAKCQSCHSAQPTPPTPMPLMTYADTQAPAPSNPGEQVWERIRVRIESSGNPMPPLHAQALTDSERQVLRAWLSQGAPGSSVVCSP
jgi:uncharacterized membrane protein